MRYVIAVVNMNATVYFYIYSSIFLNSFLLTIWLIYNDNYDL